MKISWIGHSCFLLETEKGTKIITDPYEPGGYGGVVGYSAIDVSADLITVSHQHSDHNCVRGLDNSQVVDRQGKVSFPGVEIEGILSYHDKELGAARGENIIFVILTEGLKIVHLGDLGTEEIALDKLQDVDVLLIPVGGTFTLSAKEATALVDKIKPKVTIPMHFKTPKLGFDIDRVDAFLQGKDYENKNILEVTKENIGSFKNLLVLDYQR